PPTLSPLFPYTTLFDLRDGNRRSCKTLRTQRVIDQRLNLSCQQIQIRPIAGVAGAEENHLVCTAQGDGAAIGACDQQTECEICRDRKSTRLNSSHVKIS